MSGKGRLAVLWAAVHAALVVLVAGLADGSVPVPDEAKWIVPVIVAAITATSPYLKLWSRS